MIAEQRLHKLKAILEEAGSAAIALSGGTDSVFLTHVASGIGSFRLLAVTIDSPYMFASEVSEASAFCRDNHIRHRIIKAGIPEIVLNNPPDRCYLCKSEVMKLISGVARDENLRWVFDGTNADDVSDHRPGMKALKEFGIRSPLLEAGLTKNDIRNLSEKAGLKTWNIPSNACLMTRFPHDTVISHDELRKAESAEMVLASFGLTGARLRVHNDLARIECRKEQITLFSDHDLRQKIISGLKELGYRYITLDLEGYRTGSMNPKNN